MSRPAEETEGAGVAGEGGPGRGARTEGAREPDMLPQWVLDRLHTPTHVLCRALWRIRIRGTENIPPPESGGLVIASNHQTYIDPFWVSIPVKRPIRYLAWSEPFKHPVLGKLMELLGAWPLQIERGNPTALRRSVQWLRGGGALVIFPEGARARSDGQVARFKPGAARIALEAGVPVLPVTIRNGNKVWPRGQTRPRLVGQVEIVYHPLQKLELGAGEDVKACARRVTETLEARVRSAL